MITKLVPFTKDMIPEAGALLAKRHQRDRRILSILPSRFESREIASKAIEALLEKQNTSGYTAIRNGKIVAYFLGTTTVEPWGRCGWTYLPGSALAEGESVETLQDMYVLLGDDWVKLGVFIHHTYLSKADEKLVNAWFGLDFGKERVDAILDFREIEISEIQIPDGIQIRRVGSGDNEHLANMSNIIFRQLEKAPYWHPTPPDVWSELREGWAELADDTAVSAWLALDGEQPVGTIGFWPPEESATDMLSAPKMSYMSVAATRPESRGRGIGTALAWTGLKYCLGSGVDFCITNWISPNLSASRFWPRFGFKEVSYRLTKNINPMIS